MASIRAVLCAAASPDAAVLADLADGDPDAVKALLSRDDLELVDPARLLAQAPTAIRIDWVLAHADDALAEKLAPLVLDDTYATAEVFEMDAAGELHPRTVPLPLWRHYLRTDGPTTLTTCGRLTRGPYRRDVATLIGRRLLELCPHPGNPSTYTELHHHYGLCTAALSALVEDGPVDAAAGVLGVIGNHHRSGGATLPEGDLAELYTEALRLVFAAPDVGDATKASLAAGFAVDVFGGTPTGAGCRMVLGVQLRALAAAGERWPVGIAGYGPPGSDDAITRARSADPSTARALVAELADATAADPTGYGSEETDLRVHLVALAAANPAVDEASLAALAERGGPWWATLVGNALIASGRRPRTIRLAAAMCIGTGRVDPWLDEVGDTGAVVEEMLGAVANPDVMLREPVTVEMLDDLAAAGLLRPTDLARLPARRLAQMRDHAAIAQATGEYLDAVLGSRLDRWQLFAELADGAETSIGDVAAQVTVALG